SFVLFVYSFFRRLNLKFPLQEHGWMALNGLFMFSLTYVSAYLAINYMSSGLVAIVFSFFVFLNMVGMRLFFATPMRLAALSGAVLGVMGVMIIFVPMVGPVSNGRNLALGLTFAFAGTVSSSLGNLVTFRNFRKGIPVVQ